MRPESTGAVRHLAYRPEIDGLRGLAVLAVMGFHARLPYAGGGYVGVDVFFVISGYLITRIIWHDMAGNTFSLRRFYERRARRLLPALLVTSAVSTLAAWRILPPPDLEAFGGHLVAAALFSANIVYWQQSEYFATAAEQLPLIHTWSLAIEEQYYLAFPLLLLVLSRFGRRGTACLLLGLLLLSLGLAHVLTRSSVHADAAFFLLPTRAWELLAGALLALLEAARRRPDSGAATPHGVAGAATPHGVAGALAGLGLALCVGSALWFTPATRHPSLLTLLPVGGTCLIIAFAGPATLAGRAFAARPMLGLGLISYSVYLAHQPILAFSRIALARDLSLPESGLALLASLLAGALSWRWIEQPFRTPGRIATRSVVASALAGTAAASATGAILMLAKDLPGRRDPRIAAIFDSIEAGRRARFQAIGNGRCHYQRSRHTAADIARFLGNWSCLPATSPRILVVGDSVAADRAWALREAGYEVANLTGGGCGLLPPANRDEPCWHILAKARNLVRDGAVHGLVLAQHWPAAVPADELERIVAYWRQPGVPMLAFSGMPLFRDFQKRIPRQLRAGKPLEGIGYDAAALDLHERSLAPLRRLGVTVLDTRDLLCGDRVRRCSAFLDGVPIVGDQIHLQPAGTSAMAARLRRDPGWLQWHRALLQP